MDSTKMSELKDFEIEELLHAAAYLDISEVDTEQVKESRKKIVEELKTRNVEDLINLLIASCAEVI